MNAESDALLQQALDACNAMDTRHDEALELSDRVAHISDAMARLQSDATSLRLNLLRLQNPAFMERVRRLKRTRDVTAE